MMNNSLDPQDTSIYQCPALKEQKVVNRIVYIVHYITISSPEIKEHSTRTTTE